MLLRLLDCIVIVLDKVRLHRYVFADAEGKRRIAMLLRMLKVIFTLIMLKVRFSSLLLWV